MTHIKCGDAVGLLIVIGSLILMFFAAGAPS